MRKLRPPGPSGHLLTGNARDFRQDQLGFLTRSAREFGDITRLRFFHVPVLLLSNPQHIEFVFTSRNFTKSMSLRLPLQRRIFGRGLLSSTGDAWLRQRRITQPAFHHDRLTKYAEIMIEHTRQTLAGWKNGDIRDVYEEMRALALRIAAACFFNSNNGRDHAIIRNACKEITGVFETQGSAGWIIDNLLPTPKHLRFREAIGRLDQIIYELVASHQRDNSQSADLLSMLLSARDENGDPLSPQQLRDELATLFFASHEAVALALSWTCYLLTKHPDAQSAAIAELRGVLDGREWPSPQDFPSLSYTGRVIKESLRLYPPNRSVGREALNDCEIGGYDVSAGSQVLMSQWVVHRDARNFEHPEDFNPGRWTPEFTRQLAKYAYFPFGGGPRVCVGQDFAMMEATLVIATILSKFSLSPADDQIVEPHPVVLLRPRNGIKIKLRDRDHEGD